MRSETMTPEERVMAAIRLEKPDRVPIAPLLDAAAACTLVGKTAHEVYAKGRDEMLETCLQAYDKYGGWDAVPCTAPADEKAYSMLGQKVLPPTEERKELQILEDEYFTVEDYERVIEEGWAEFAFDTLALRVYDWEDPEAVWDDIFELMGLMERANEGYSSRGAKVLFPGFPLHPFFQLSMVRSMLNFAEDLYYRGDLVEAALDKMVPEFIEQAITRKSQGYHIAPCVEERAGAFFYPPKIFERFWWPYTRRIVEELWAEGITTWFHLDTDWIKNLEYFKELPRGSAVLGFDGTTDIFAAKDILRNHICIATDIHPTLMSIGSPDDVEEYCKKLIDEIGGDGGMILSSGCWLPAAIKPENFRAMIESGKTYELSQ